MVQCRTYQGNDINFTVCIFQIFNRVPIGIKFRNETGKFRIFSVYKTPELINISMVQFTPCPDLSQKILVTDN